MSVRQSWCIWRMRAAPIFQQFVILLWLCGSHISLRILVLCKCHTQSVVIRDGSCESESCSAWEHRWYDLLKQVFWPVVKRTMFWFEPQFVTFVWSEFNWILPLFFFLHCVCVLSQYTVTLSQSIVFPERQLFNWCHSFSSSRLLICILMTVVIICAILYAYTVTVRLTGLKAPTN